MPHAKQIFLPYMCVKLCNKNDPNAKDKCELPWCKWSIVNSPTLKGSGFGGRHFDGVLISYITNRHSFMEYLNSGVMFILTNENNEIHSISTI